MKINWGTGIFLFYGVFVLTFVFLVFKSTQYDHSLVSDQYYADDIAYQKHYDKLVNSEQLREDLVISQDHSSTTVELKFPEGFEEFTGEIHFFCPSDSGQDFKVQVKPGPDNRQAVSVQGLKTGLWKIKVDWEADGTTFYKEEVIII